MLMASLTTSDQHSNPHSTPFLTWARMSSVIASSGIPISLAHPTTSSLERTKIVSLSAILASSFLPYLGLSHSSQTATCLMVNSSPQVRHFPLSGASSQSMSSPPHLGQVMISPSAYSLRFSIGITPFQSFELLGAPTRFGRGSHCATVPVEFQKCATAGNVPAIEGLRLSRSASAIGHRHSIALLAI